MKRREFLGGCAGLTAASLTSSVLQLQMTNSAVAALSGLQRPNDYKALVCVFLFGGNDSFNMLVPLGRNGNEREFDNYTEARDNLALDRSAVSSRGINGPGNRSFVINGNMPEVEDMYRNNDLSFIANVGTLAQPIRDAAEFASLSRARKPRGLFSHNDQQEIWQTSVADRASRSGWMGRVADVVNDEVNSNDSISMNISVGRTNLLQSGASIVPYVVSPNGAVELRGFRGIYRDATNGVINRNYANTFKNQYRIARQQALESSSEYNSLISGVNVDSAGGGAPRFRGRLGEQLELVARNIRARNQFGSTRQTFFVFQDGYDTHANLNDTQPGLLAELSESLAAFNNEMRAIGVHDQVTTYTASDFGRTLTTNGRGSDHAWGGNQMVMGGAVRGGRIFGDYPEDLRNPTSRSGRELDVGRGRILPTTSVDEMHAELARWYGIPNDNSLTRILPNIRRFHGAGVNANMPIGFLPSTSTT